MKPIKLYFAAAWAGGGKGEVNLIEAGVKNKLVSFVYPTQLDGWIENLPCTAEGNIMIDSGAFTAWNKGKQIDLNAYIQYAQNALERIKPFKKQKMHIVNLDVIPGHVGQTHSLNTIQKKENHELIETAASIGYKNMRRMLKEGITPIHVFHQGEDFIWIDRMVEHIPYIGISPANDVSSNARNKWISVVFEYLYRRNIKVETHGFAITNHKILRDFPWTSCDAASWRIAAGMGNINYPKGGFSNPDYSQTPLTINVSAQKTGKGIKHMQPLFLQKLEEDGYTYDALQTWQCRTLINVRYLLGLETWLNMYKEKTEYTPQMNFGF